MKNSRIEEKLNKVRALMAEENLDAYIIPHTDEHLGEFIPPFNARLEYMTGFTGSAGNCIITQDDCTLFVDNRYEIQAPEEVDGSVCNVCITSQKSLWEWLAQTLHKGMRVGLDGWIHPCDEVVAYQKACAKAEAELVFLKSNLIDRIWQDRKGVVVEKPVFLHPLQYAGVAHAEKITKICATLRAQKTDALVLSDPYSICWLLNIRGADLEYAPAPLCYGILHQDETVELYIALTKIIPEVKAALAPQVQFKPYESFEEGLRKLAGQNVWVDPEYNPYEITRILHDVNARTYEKTDPCILGKACKNPVEVEGARQAHIRDGAILCDLYSWISQSVAKGSVDELTIANKLEELRHQQKEYLSPSFSSIVGSGANGAKVHYRSSAKTNRVLKRDDLLLIDVGAQYVDGTTDVTRVLCFQDPTEEQKQKFTLVLKGNIALSSIRFPKGTCGVQLDVLARAPLWRVGLDYGHGTGHGVGSVAGVHEGPQRISKAGRDTNVALQSGMILSNEPGFYKAGEYGMRIENLLVVTPFKKTEGSMFEFETLTMAPLGRQLIKVDMLTAEEIEWVDSYHAQVYSVLQGKVQEESKQWLEQETRPLRNT